MEHSNGRPPRGAVQQLDTFKRLMEGKTLPATSPVLQAACVWLKNCPIKLQEEEKDELVKLICGTFALTKDELAKRIFDSPTSKLDVDTTEVHNAEDIERDLWEIIPPSGFIHDYCRFASHNEAPLAYHLFCALLVVGAVVNRRVWFNMGYFRLFPPLGIILLGPSGVKKTTSSDIVVGILQEMGVTKIYSEKLTPEALVEGMRDCAQGLVYAPELAVMLGKQKYNEGMIPLLTRFMDCPDVWVSETITRGQKPLNDIAISILMCSTPDWFVENTPEDTFGGGFIARTLLVMQGQGSPRLVSVPKAPTNDGRVNLAATLAKSHTHEGEIIFAPGVGDKYHNWYVQHKKQTEQPDHKLLTTYYQRKPQHALRIAIIFHLVQHGDLILCWECVDRAIKLLDWNEQFLPDLLREMFRTQEGVEQSSVLQTIRNNGGVIEHSLLVRRLQYKMSAAKLRGILSSLKEAKQVEEKVDPVHAWVLRG